MALCLEVSGFCMWRNVYRFKAAAFFTVTGFG